MCNLHRMPLILAREEWAVWTAGAPEAALRLCRTWQGYLDVDRTLERWSGGANRPDRDRLI